MPGKALATIRIVWDRCRGRNPIDDPSALPDDIAQYVENINVQSIGLGKKRAGCFSSMPSAASPAHFTDVYSLTSGNVLLNSGVYSRRMIGLDGQSPPRIIEAINGNTEAQGGLLADACTGNQRELWGVEFNGLIYLCYQSAENRLYAYHPDAGVVRTGLPKPVAPTAADTGAGAYAATIRYYRIQWRTVATNGRTVRSNLGTALSFTPSGAGTAARVTRPTAPSATANEWETHWAVYASADGANCYDISGSIALATTTFDDSITPSTYFSGREAAPPEGTFTPWPAVRFLLAAGERLIGFGVFTSAPATGTDLSIVPGRVFFSPVMNTTDTNDNERISNTSTIKGYIDLAPPRGGGQDRALAGPINDMVLAFRNRGIWGLVPTGDAAVPYRRVRLDPVKGATNQWSTFVGEDEQGRPCVYFLDYLNGPYRYGDRGFEWLGYETQDVWRRFNAEATGIAAHGVWDRRTSRAIFWMALDAANDPTHCFAFHAKYGRPSKNNEVRGGWVEHTGLVATARCSTIGFDANYVDIRKKYDRVILGLSGTSGDLVLMDRDGQQTDDPDGAGSGTAFTASITSRAFSPAPAQTVKTLGAAHLQAAVLANALINVTAHLDYKRQVAVGSDVSLTAETVTQLSVIKKFATLQATNFQALQFILSDTNDNDVGEWELHRFLASMEVGEEA